MGLPQGSVLAPLLFSIFIIDMFSGIDGDHCKFADDGTFWHSGDHIQHLVEKICKDVGILKDWCRKWRMHSMPIHVLQYVIHAQKRSCTHLSFGTYVQKRRVIFVHA